MDMKTYSVRIGSYVSFYKAIGMIDLLSQVFEYLTIVCDIENLDQCQEELNITINLKDSVKELKDEPPKTPRVSLGLSDFKFLLRGKEITKITPTGDAIIILKDIGFDAMRTLIDNADSWERISGQNQKD